MREALCGFCGIDGQERRSRTDGRVQRNHLVGTSWKSNADNRFRADSTPGESGRRAACACGERGGVQRVDAGFDQRGVRVGAVLERGVEQRDERRVCCRNATAVRDVVDGRQLRGRHGRDVDHGQVGWGVDESSQEVHDPVVMHRDVVGGVHIRICLEVESHAAGEAVVDVDRRVFDGAGGQHVQFAAQRAEVDVLEEQHDVDHRTEESAPAVGVVEDVGGDLFVAETLMSHSVFDVGVHDPQRVGDGRRGVEFDADG